MPFATFVNSAGLALNIIGAVLLWKFGLPPEIDPTRKAMTPEAAAHHAGMHDFYSRLGGFLTVGGFALQLIANFLV